MTREEAEAINKAEFEAESRAALERALAYAANKRAEEQEKLAALGWIKDQPSKQKPRPKQPIDELRVFRPERFAKRYEAHGESKTLVQWAQQVGIHPDTIRQRLKRGFTVEQAIDPNGRAFSTAKTHTLNGKDHTIDEWAEIKGINRRTIDSRLRMGWTLEEALTRPVASNGRGRVEAPVPDEKTGGVPSAQETLELEVFA